MNPHDVRNRRFSIIGGARSGLAVARLLKQEGARVFLSDSAPLEKMQAAASELDSEGIASEFGGNTVRVLDADVIVVSPGVPSDAPLVRTALQKGIRVFSELEVASWFCPAPMIAITGTNGKTTTTALEGRMFEDARRPSVVAGNIGTAFAQVVGGVTAETTVILEVSSFQLDFAETFRPAISVLLNITPDHLDRYEHSFEKYIAAKCRIFSNQRDGDIVIYSRDDVVTRESVERHVPPGVRRLSFGLGGLSGDGAYLEKGRLKTAIDGTISDLIAADEVSIKGMHNLANAMAASLAARSCGIPAASIRATLRNFKGVEHRLEFVRQLEGVTFVNDSKATNVDSVWYALQSFTGPIIVLIGGRDKGNDYSRLADLVRKHVKAIIAIGESAEKVRSAFAPLVPVTVAGTMEEAVHAAARRAIPGDTVLLSPACASFDWFENYEHRGRVFKEIVMRLKGSGQA